MLLRVPLSDGSFLARLGYEKYPDFVPFQELLTYLAKEDHAYHDYQPKPTYDCSFLNRPLRIVIYEGVLPVMDYTAEQFRQTFERLGHEVFVFDDKAFSDSAAALLSFAKRGIDFVLLFNNVGAGLTDDQDRNFWEKMNATCINYLFDHPLYYYQQMEKMPENAVITCVDRNHVNYIRRFHKNIRRAFFFPLGAEYIPEDALSVWSNRPIDVLYVGSLKNTQDMPDSFMGRMIFKTLLKHTSLTYEEAAEYCLNQLLSVLKECGIDITEIRDISELEMLAEKYEKQVEKLPDVYAQANRLQEEPYRKAAENHQIREELLNVLLQKYRYIDMNVNAYFRKTMIVVLVNAGIDVHVYGNGWSIPELSDQPHFHFGGLLSQTECIRKMQESKIVLNSMPWFKDGAHDRIFNAMLSHAVCVTDGSEYLTERFTDGKELICYSLEEIEKLPGIVRGLLDYPKEAEKIAERGYQSAVLSHSWENRAMELLTRYIEDNWE